MKKILTLVMALALILSMGAFTAMAEDVAEPDGTEANPYVASNPMMAPYSLTVPAGTTVYYSFDSNFFGGQTMLVTGDWNTSVTVDGAPFNPNRIGVIEVVLAPRALSMLVGFANSGEADVELTIEYKRPVGTMDSPFELMDGENIVAIEEGTMEYYALYVPMSNGDATITISGLPTDVAVEAALDMMGEITVFAADEEGNLVATAALSPTPRIWSSSRPTALLRS